MAEYLIPIILAALTGGVVVTLLNHLFATPDKFQKLKYNEKDRLIQDIERLSKDVDELRQEVSEMRVDIAKKVELISGLSARWYALRTVVMSLVTYLKHQQVLVNDAELERLVIEALGLVDEHSSI